MAMYSSLLNLNNIYSVISTGMGLGRRHNRFKPSPEKSLVLVLDDQKKKKKKSNVITSQCTAKIHVLFTCTV